LQLAVSHLFDFVMASVITLTDAQKEAAMKVASSDLQFLFDRKQVSEEVQAVFYHIGVTTVEAFAVLVKNQDELEEMLGNYFGLNLKDLPDKVKSGKVVAAWMAAKVRAAKQADMEGDCEARRVPKDVPSSDMTAMRRSYEKKYWELEERNIPGKSYMEKKLDEIEKDELRAEALSEVICTTEDDPDTLKAVWNSNNELRAVKVGAKAALPRDPEELRRRIHLMGTALIFAGFQQTHKSYLKGVDPQLYHEYVDYLLGENVHGLVAKTSYGASVAGPSWTLLLAYEQAIRSKAVQLVRKGSTYREALKKAWEDPIIKERNFTTPLCLESASKRPWTGGGAEEYFYTPPLKYGKAGSGKDGGGKGKTKGKAKGKGKGKDKGKVNIEAPPGCAAMTPQGKPVCFRFNSGTCNSSKKQCRYAHVCGVCFKVGVPMTTCKHTQG